MTPLAASALTGAISGWLVALLIVIPWRWRNYQRNLVLRLRYEESKSYVKALEAKLYNVRRLLGALELEPTEKAVERLKRAALNNVFEFRRTKDESKAH